MTRILVVDDDPDFVSVVRTILLSAGHEVDTAANGGQALQRMRAQRPDVILLDIMMSYVLDGLDVVREMARDPALKDIPVLIVSSLTSVEGVSGMFPTDEAPAADGWISKPVDPDDLLRRIAEVLPGGASKPEGQ
ncbi:MAG: response regulator [Anaerolineae bacterium]